jgi:hypothetical protein
LAGQGDLFGASDQLERVLEIEPDNQSARRSLEKLRAAREAAETQ